MKKVWPNEKTQLSVDVLKSILLIKFNFDLSYQAFCAKLRSSPNLNRFKWQILNTEIYTDFSIYVYFKLGHIANGLFDVCLFYSRKPHY